MRLNHVRYREDGHPRNAQATPPYILEPCRRLLGGIGLDPATDPDNPTRAEVFYCLPNDGSALPWTDRVWLNPPYGKAQEKFLERAILESKNGLRIIALVPSRTETKINQRCMGAAQTILFINARLQFALLRECGRREAASHGSVLYGFNVDLSSLKKLGVVVAGVAYQEPERVTTTWEEI